MINKKLHVVTVVGTRPEIIRLSRVISRLNDSSAIKHTLIHTGQNHDYNLNEVFFNELEINKPDIFLDCAAGNSIQTIGNILLRIEPVLDKISPDAFLVLGDTNSCLSAIVAKKKKIPIFHMEAGNRCFDQNVPEETNRKIVDHISDINLPYSKIARDYLLNEGIQPDRIIKTGSPMAEVLNYYSDKFDNSSILSDLKLENEKYFVVSSHREENVDSISKLEKLISILNSLIEKYSYPVVFSTHPRTKKQLNKVKVKPNQKINFLEPLGFVDYIFLQKNAFVVLSDSGTISEESSILNFRALNIRSSNERPEAMEEAAVLMTDIDENRIFQGVESVISQKLNSRDFDQVKDYNSLNISKKIERIIISYTDYINKNVWKKES